MPEQTSLVLIKPDAVQRALVGTILQRLERKGLRIIGLRMLLVDEELASRHYAEHVGKPFYPPLLRFITSGPLVTVAVRGDNAIAVVRALVGPTDGREAPPGTIRGDLGLSNRLNLIHASDSPTSAGRELALWFPDGLDAGERCDTAWVEVR
jgi:nucleoside-diphosphate kinase